MVQFRGLVSLLTRRGLSSGAKGRSHSVNVCSVMLYRSETKLKEKVKKKQLKS